MPFFGVPIRNGLPIGLGSVAGFGAPQEFSPSELFLGGTAGAWYDPSDLSTMFDTSAGTTPVAMPGQGAAVPVGLMLDKSQGLVLGSELVTNGDFSQGSTGWTAGAAGVTIIGGAVLYISVSSTFTLRQSGVITAEKTYEVQYEITAYTGGTIQAKLNGTVSALGLNRSATGVYKEYITSTSTADGILAFAVSGFTGTIDNISVRELPGNHAISFNNTTARPELRARVNLLVATATLSTQNVTTQATSYTLRFAGTGSITLSGTATGSYSAGTHTITCTAGTLTLTVSGAVTTADLRPANSGALLPAYQAVVDANTYDTSGFPLYLRFDGIDDSMYTPANLNLSGTDKVAVFAGVRKLSDATNNCICEFSSNATNNGSFGVWTGTPFAANSQYHFNTKGTSLSTATTSAGYTLPISNVLAGFGDIGGDSAILRVDGTQAASSTADQGAGNYGTYALYIGARNNSSFWLNGHLYSLVVAGSAVSAGNISATEQWVAGKTGIQI